MQFSFRKSNVTITRERLVPRPADPAVPTFSTPSSGERSRGGPFVVSLGLHVFLAGSVFLENYLRPPLELQVDSVEQLLADDRYELTWPVRPSDLPPVEPVETPKAETQQPQGDGAPPRFQLPQQVVANAPDAASSRQMIWDQAPQVELTKDVPAPNFVEPPRPQVQRLRFELAEAQLLAPARPALAAERAPAVETSARSSSLEAIGKSPPLRYWTPETEPAAPERRALAPETAPEIEAGPAQALDLDQIQRQARLRYWTPEQKAAEPSKQALAAEKAPAIAAAPTGGVDVGQFQRLSRLRYQQAEASQGDGAAPQPRALEAPEGAPALPINTGQSASRGGADELVQQQTLAALGSIEPPAAGRAVVGVDPVQDASAVVPRGERGGNFTAGPDGGASSSTGAGNGSVEGDAGAGGAVAAVRIPNLSVTPASPGAAIGLSDKRPPERGTPEIEREALLSQFRNAKLSPLPGVGVVAKEGPPDPEFPFPGRAVYTLAVNMPNVNSYSGSWIMEFAEVKKGEAIDGNLQPPSPRFKVDPVYTRAAIDERVEGDVVLHAVIRSDGLVGHIQVIKKLDERLDESAKAALSKWRFQPATKNGVPIDIETVVRIPFRLTPRYDKRR
ncbi:MAG: energy transducer TonB [Bryobacterales bacterium]